MALDTGGGLVRGAPFTLLLALLHPPPPSPPTLPTPFPPLR